MPFVVAMSMQSKEIGWCIIRMISINMIDFNQIAFSERQFAPATFSLLPLEKFGELSSEQWMVFQSLAPAQQISIIWTGLSSDFGVWQRIWAIPCFLMVIVSDAANTHF